VIESSLKGNANSVFLESKLEITGSHTELAKKSKVETTSKKREETITCDLIETAGKEIATRNEDTRDLVVHQNIEVDAKKNLLLAGAEKLVGVTKIGELKAGKSVTLKVGNTVIKMHDNQIEVMAVKSISVNMRGDNSWNAFDANQDLLRDAPTADPATPAGEP
jgi:hypothetical protein